MSMVIVLKYWLLVAFAANKPSSSVVLLDIFYLVRNPDILGCGWCFVSFIEQWFLVFFLGFVFSPGDQPSALQMVNEHSTTESPPSPIS